MSSLSAEHVVARNFPWCDEHDDSSFLGRLHEESVWDESEYWELEWALHELMLRGAFERELAWRIFRVFSHTMLVLGCHFDPNDGYRIRDLSADDAHEWRERFQLVFEGFFSGHWPSPSALERSNPLLPADAS
jgi:hypothetical protein